MTQPETNRSLSDSRAATEIVDSAIRNLGNIATLPAVTEKIVRVTSDPDSTLQDLQDIIAVDPALSARVLKVVNSPFYGQPGQVASIGRAVVLLGLNSVKNIAIAASLDKVFGGGCVSSGFDTRDLWTHSIAVASGAFLIAEKVGAGVSGEAFLAGLIHDLGIMIEMESYLPYFGQVISKLSTDENLAFRQAEKQVLGATHEAFGAALCRKWQFPESHQYVAGFHHRPFEVPAEHRQLTMIVHAADVLAARSGTGYTRTVETDTIDRQILLALNLTKNDMEGVADALLEATQEAQ